MFNIRYKIEVFVMKSMARTTAIGGDNISELLMVHLGIHPDPVKLELFVNICKKGLH